MMANKRTLSAYHYWGLSVLFLAVLLVAGDFTAFSPALSAIASSFTANLTSVHWVVNAYSLTYGVIIVTAGRLADIYGRRRLFIFGVLIFAISSFVGGLAEILWVLLFCRALMGLAGALIWSAIIGMAYTLLPEEKAGLAGGLMLAALGLSTALGPVLGGFFTEYLSWRWILFLNVPMAFLVIFLGWKRYPVDEIQNIKEGIDFLGVMTLSMSLFCFLLAMDFLAQNQAIDFFSISLLITSVLFLISFLFREISEKSSALIPVDLLENISFLSVAFSVLLVAASFFSILIYIPLLLIEVYQFSALLSGMALLPMMIASSIFAFVSGVLHEKAGAKWLICVGAFGMAAGVYWLSILHKGASYIQFVPGLILVGVSLGIYGPAVVTAAVALVDPSRSSLAGAIIYMFRFIGGALALGINATILASTEDVTVGIYRAFTLDAYITFIGFLLPLFFFGRLDKHIPKGD
ncbi:MFS transporter [Microbulbifer variabilis]|uniref:MFS transporter n=1 Tax=Microbulbifer variabilis TaxID=266805 RepID=UPI001CFCA822|nr:MFS transporter [Microbulbifer variabilis]